MVRQPPLWAEVAEPIWMRERFSGGLATSHTSASKNASGQLKSNNSVSSIRQTRVHTNKIQHRRATICLDRLISVQDTIVARYKKDMLKVHSQRGLTLMRKAWWISAASWLFHHCPSVSIFPIQKSPAGRTFLRRIGDRSPRQICRDFFQWN